MYMNLEICDGIDMSNSIIKQYISGQTESVNKIVELANKNTLDFLDWIFINNYERQQDGSAYWFNKDNIDYTPQELLKKFTLETQTTYPK